MPSSPYFYWLYSLIPSLLLILLYHTFIFLYPHTLIFILIFLRSHSLMLSYSHEGVRAWGWWVIGPWYLLVYEKCKQLERLLPISWLIRPSRYGQINTVLTREFMPRVPRFVMPPGSDTPRIVMQCKTKPNLGNTFSINNAYIYTMGRQFRACIPSYRWAPLSLSTKNKLSYQVQG